MLYYFSYFSLVTKIEGFILFLLGIGLVILLKEKVIDYYYMVKKSPRIEVNGQEIYVFSGRRNIGKKEFIIANAAVPISPKPKIVVTDTLIELLNNEELSTVIKHEEGHIRFRHHLALIFFEISLAITIGLLNFLVSFKFTVYSYPLLPMVTLVLGIIAVHTMERRGEKEADWYAERNTDREYFISALNKITSFNRKYFPNARPAFNKIFDAHGELQERALNYKYNPFSFSETIKFLLPFIILVFINIVLISFLQPNGFDAMLLFYSLSIITLSLVVYIILTKFGIKEYLARTSILSYLSLSSLSLLFFGPIENIIANAIAIIISVSIYTNYMPRYI